MRFARLMLCLYPLWAMPVVADEAAANKAQLMQLNRASQQQLKNIQRPLEVPAPASPQQQGIMRQQLNRQQRIDQRVLQERQRRNLVLRKHRARTAAPGQPQQVKPAIQRHRFYLQQQNQLGRFRAQQRLRVR